MTDSVSQLGPYRLGGLLAETATSRVFLAERVDLPSTPPLVCKVFHAAPDALAQALAERAKGLLALAGQGVLVPKDVGRVGPQLIVARPRAKALTLAEMGERALKSRRVISHGVAVKVVVDVLEALTAAHAHKPMPNGDAWLTHGAIGADHILVDDAGRVMLLGLESPRGSTPGQPPALKLDLAGASATLYDLLAPKKSSDLPQQPIPPEFAQLLTAALGLGNTRHRSAAALRDAVLATAQKSRINLASPTDLATLVRRLMEAPPYPAILGPKPPPPAPPKPALPPAKPPAKSKGPPPIPGDAGPTRAGPPVKGSAKVRKPGADGAVPRPVTGIGLPPEPVAKADLASTLRARGAITAEQLADAQEREQLGAGSLSELLLLDQTIDDAQLADGLAELARLDRASDDEVLTAEPGAFLKSVIPASLCVDRKVVPLHQDLATGAVRLAVFDPLDDAPLRQVQVLVGAPSVKASVARRSVLEAALKRLYPEEVAKRAAQQGEKTDPTFRTAEADVPTEELPLVLPPAPPSDPLQPLEPILPPPSAALEPILPPVLVPLEPIVPPPAPPAASLPLVPVLPLEDVAPVLDLPLPPLPAKEALAPSSAGGPFKEVSSRGVGAGIMGRFSLGPTSTAHISVTPAAPAAARASGLVEEMPSAIRLAPVPTVRKDTPPPECPPALRRGGEAAEAGPKPLVLLGEPDAAAAAALSARLQMEGWRVHVAVDGHGANVALDEEGLAAVVCEAALPRIPGFSVLLSVRGRESTKELPFFMMSARTDERLATRALEAGADDFLLKPVNPDLLAGKLRRAISKHQAFSGQQARTPTLPPVAPSPPPPPRSVVPPPVPETTGVAGTLKQMGLAEIVQTLEMGRKTAQVNLSFAGGESGFVVFQEGELVHAEMGPLHGADAFYDLAKPREGMFRIRYTLERPPSRTITGSATGLLLEAMRRMDEDNR